MAKNAEYGLLEGKAAALIHPAVMGLLYVFTLYTGYLGLQWRKVREVGDALKPLQEEQKSLQAKAESLKAQEQSTASIDTQLSEVVSKSAVHRFLPLFYILLEVANFVVFVTYTENAMQVSGKIAELTEQRKQLISGNFRDKHWVIRPFPPTVSNAEHPRSRKLLRVMASLALSLSFPLSLSLLDPALLRAAAH